MWAAQTYLGAHVSQARYFMYLLAEDYVSEQMEFHKSVIENCRRLGRRTGKESAIFVPDDGAEDRIAAELRYAFEEHLMRPINGKTPGILFLDKNLPDLNPAEDRWVFLSLRPFIGGTAREGLAELFTQLESAISNSEDLLSDIIGSKWKTFWNGLKDRFMFEPNFYGIGINAKGKQRRVVVTLGTK